MPISGFNKVASNFIEIALRHGCSPINGVNKISKSIYQTFLVFFAWFSYFVPNISPKAEGCSLYGKYLFEANR